MARSAAAKNGFFSFADWKILANFSPCAPSNCGNMKDIQEDKGDEDLYSTVKHLWLPVPET